MHLLAVAIIETWSLSGGREIGGTLVKMKNRGRCGGQGGVGSTLSIYNVQIT